VLSAAGAVAATLVWFSTDRTQVHLGGGFENEGMDLGVLVTELPLVFVAGAVLPVLVYALLVWLLGGRSDVSDRHG
jgi:hypothetical protein